MKSHYIHSTATETNYSSDFIYSSGIYQQNDAFCDIVTISSIKIIGFIDSSGSGSNQFISSAMFIILLALLVSVLIIIVVVFGVILSARKLLHVNCGQPQGMVEQ